MKRPIFLGIGLAAIVLLLSGFYAPPKPKSSGQLTPKQAQGQAIFQSNCAACHNSDSNQKLVGPGLRGLFHKPHLPSGAPATDAQVRRTILHGKNVMPPFADVLNDKQVNDLLAYLHTM
ncbi:MAG: cytochrome c [Acidobacteriota bacterium]